MKGTIATVTIEDARREFITPDGIKSFQSQLYVVSQDIRELLELKGLLYDLVNSQVSVELAWRHRDYPKGKPDQEGKHYDIFLETYENFLQDKRLYFQFIKEYCDTKRCR